MDTEPSHARLLRLRHQSIMAEIVYLNRIIASTASRVDSVRREALSLRKEFSEAFPHLPPLKEDH